MTIKEYQKENGHTTVKDLLNMSEAERDAFCADRGIELRTFVKRTTR